MNFNLIVIRSGLSSLSSIDACLEKKGEILARPTGLEPLTLGLEMRVIEVTNYTELHRFVYL